MTAEKIFFILVAGITLIMSGLVVSARKLMHAAFYLVGALLGVAVLFVMLGSGFFAVVQVLVYIGAIAILIIFAIMLTRNVMLGDEAQANRGWVIAGMMCIVLFGGLVAALSSWPAFTTATTAIPASGEDLTGLGIILTDPQGYAIVFEVSSIMLVAGMIGAIYIASDRKGKPE